nr:non-ribosomal peptide synthetase [Chryseobacterium sp.]
MALLLEQFIANPEIKVSEINYLLAQDRQKVIKDWNHTEALYFSDKTTISLFEEQVEKAPDHIALRFKDIAITYAELNGKANRLAAYLKETYSVEPNDKLGIYAGRTEWMIISILAILKSGAAYVPLDPEAPEQRTAYILSDAEVKVVLTDEVHQLKLMEISETPVEVINTQDFTQKLKIFSDQNIKTNTTSEDLIYVIYTSGTTGNPKGVMIEHRNVNRLIINSNYTHIDESDNILSLSSYQFDGSVYDFFYPLVHGGTVVVTDKEVFLDLHKFNQLLEEYKITNLFVTTALFNTITDAGLSNVNRLKYLLFGGEQVSVNHVNKFRTLFPTVNLVHVYGPTESTTYATSYQVNEHTSEFINTVPIGLPLGNTTVYVLDSYGSLLPVGAVGELYIGGAGVGRGYLNNPDLTSEKFIVNPFQSLEEKSRGYNGRLYRTGDLVRYLSDGCLEYIDRADFQVKIRGFRIELGEIESHLSNYEGIRQSVVLALDHASGIKYLVAYYTSDSAYTSEVLATYLSHILPDYMLPTAYVHLTEFPMTVNGKIDRRSLPRPEYTTGSHYVAPVTDTERRLTALYSEVLGIAEDTLGIDDDFFKLGGNSILAIKLTGRIGRSFSKDIPVTVLLSEKNIRRMSSYIDHHAVDTLSIASYEVPLEEQYLSFAQERLWFIEQLEGGNSAYNIPMIFRVGSQVRLDVLKESIRRVVERHEVLHSQLRTSSEGISYQCPIDMEAMPFEIGEYAFSDQSLLEEAMLSSSHTIFRLDRDYPISASLYSFGELVYASIVVHHIAFDGWSVDVFINEIYSHYNYYLHVESGNVSRSALYDLPSLSIQYKDYALWQREYLSGALLEEQISYWQDELSGYESLSLPTDYLRPSQISYEGKDLSFELGIELSKDLKDLAKELDVSLYSLLLSGYYLLLSSYSNQDDIVLGTPVSGRHTPQIEDMIGFFVNTLVLRMDIVGDELVKDYILRTGDKVRESQAHMDLPFEKLVNVLGVEKDLSRHPIFQVMFGVQSFGNPTSVDWDYPLDIEVVDSGYEQAKFDLTTMMDDSGDSITGGFNYSTRLFKESTVLGYIDTYLTILSQFVSACRKGMKVKDIEYLSVSDKQLVLEEWNATEHPYPTDKTLVDLFEEQVVLSPDAVAVTYKDRSLTYRELNERSNRVAYYLRTQYGVTKDTLVGLYQDKSEHMLISILGILKSGGAYVPLDPGAPLDRIAYMLSDTSMGLLLANEKFRERFEEVSLDRDLSVEYVDGLDYADSLFAYPLDNPGYEISVNDLAYVIYTSGTTGKPKGTMIEHTSVVNRIFWMNEEYPIHKDDVILQKTPYTFDVSVWEIFWANWYGARIVFVDSAQYKDNLYILDLIDKEKITVMHFVPTMLTSFENTLDEYEDLQYKTKSLKYLFCSGEALLLSQVQKFKQLVPECRIHNLYGPTEATVDVLYYDCNDKDIAKVLIGKPIYNTTAYVLDEYRRVVPVGAIGELYIGGVNVARGYLKREDLTAEKFLSNPFQSEKDKLSGYNSRLYRTGDLVRVLEDGNIEYIGRNDFQVKIRGLRIELEEIEARLASYPGVGSSVILVKENVLGDQYLVGYYTSPQEIKSKDIEEYLLKFLPDYMVPLVFVHLLKLPFTANGKLDRNALPSPQISHEEIYLAPETHTERVLCDICGEILGMEASGIGMGDSFFRLGGTSISAVRFVNKIKNVLGKKIKLIDVLNTGNLRDLAKIIEEQYVYQPVIKMNNSQGEMSMFMIHPGMAGCQVYSSLAEKLSPLYQCFGVDSYNLHHEEHITSLRSIAEYYLENIDKTVENLSSYHLIGWSLGGNIALEIASLLEEKGITDIHVHLLDSWLIPSEEIDVERSPDVFNDFQVSEKEKEFLTKLMVTEEQISDNPVSGKLEHTKINLIKATRNDKNKYYEMYKLNNIDSCVNDVSQIDLFNVDAEHLYILEKEDEIMEIIMSYNINLS